MYDHSKTCKTRGRKASTFYLTDDLSNINIFITLTRTCGHHIVLIEKKHRMFYLLMRCKLSNLIRRKVYCKYTTIKFTWQSNYKRFFSMSLSLLLSKQTEIKPKVFCVG